MLKRLDLGAGHLVLEQLPSTDAQPGQDGECEHDDPDAADPLGELAPDRDAVRQLLDAADDASARGAEAGHPLEVRVERPPELWVSGEDVGEGAEPSRRKPGERDDEEAFADAESALAAGRSGEL